MSDVIIVGILSLVGTLAGSYFSQRKTTALVVYRLEQLEKKVEKHNTFDTRVKELEKTVGIHDEKIKVASHRIGSLEKLK